MWRFWEAVIKLILIKTNSKKIIEIGAYKGENTIKLLEYCKAICGTLVVVDPEPHEELKRLNKEFKGYLQISKDFSLNVLPTLNNYDTVIIDGDHNWYTVYNELKTIEKAAIKQGRFPIIILHDTEWPYGRRDMYYYPKTIPERYRKPYAKKGIAKGYTKLIDCSKEGEEAPKVINNDLNNALFEGGEKNGVLTGIEDFLKESKIPLSFHRISSFHGLGILNEQNLELDNFISYIIKSSGL
ncbi:class I SAM-dependent methyltransferase [Bacillus sp. ISL-47]|uniref:class I SAM-dependent methyltransferase n=1 Tax=Bacillus sp. ISL-47 TaxID=2819130 RepID=UPI001BE764AD|nr:class I SAM-dependent methyltransferase [Bacillus sp. ISL-47]MBT2686888.1 class I SAM-dependent methyltransferase [Bacillus sp. ISL-47]MBT2710427.1 class I SAM-dependent methyltransferase [Pseudomonas sp. ISL-84]